MSEFKQTSQYGQDEFVWRILGEKENGRFLDIGAGYAFRDSNTASLEKYGWDGMCVDSGKDGTIDIEDWQHRVAPLWIGGVERMELPADFKADYISIDVDEDSYLALEKLTQQHGFHRLTSCPGASVITIEHDAYRFGTDMRDKQRETLTCLGYELLCPSVYPSEQWKEIVWEDWWVWPSAADRTLKEKVRGMRNVEEILAKLRG